MSVINQMLKELEQRNSQPQKNTTFDNSLIQRKSSFTIKLALIILVIVLINIIGLYSWSLYSEKKILKKTESNKQEIALTTTTKPEPIDKVQAIKKSNLIENTPAEAQAITTQNTENKNSTSLTSKISIQPDKIIDNGAHHVASKTQIKDAQINQNSRSDIDPITGSNTNLSTQSKQLSQQAQQAQNIHVKPLPKHPSNILYKKPSANVIAQPNKNSSLSISRSKLSPERVVKNKFKKAERAILDNNISKAEQLLEDILIIQPAHKAARKQLSALWFGRKAYKPALNLLAQGVIIYPNDIEFRLMQARILLNQDNNKEAFYVLNTFSTAQNIEYQLLLANTAQSLGKLESAILAYQQLVSLEAHKGKWWLGLAVAFDRNSQFEQAKKTYETALSKSTLSSHSIKFIKQRITELGE